MRIATSVWSTILSLLVVVLIGGCNHDKVNELIVTPKESSVPVGFQLQLKAETLSIKGKVVDVTKNNGVTWESSDESIATVDENGLVTAGEDSGRVWFTASGEFDGKRFTDDAIVDVVYASVSSLEVTPQNTSVPVGLQRTFDAHAQFSNGQSLTVTNDALTVWESNNPYVASVSNSEGSKGVAKGELTGSSSISATLLGQTNEASLQVTPAVVTSLSVNPEVEQKPVGLSQQLKAIAQLSDGTTFDVTGDDSIRWVSTEVGVADFLTNDSPGLITALAVGSTEIQLTGIFNGEEFKAAGTFNVTNDVITSISVSPPIVSVPVGMSTPFKVEANLSSGAVLDITKDNVISWSSSDSDIATVSNSLDDRGTATGVALGRVGITAYGVINGVEQRSTASLDVIEPVIVGLKVSPKPQANLETPQIPVGRTKQFTAEVTLSDGSLVDVTNSENLVWLSGEESVALISNNESEKGLATGIEVGDTFITAQWTSDEGSFYDSSLLTVTPLHTMSFNVFTETYRNEVQGKPVEYIGYARRTMGAYEILSGNSYLDSSLELMYIDGGNQPIKHHTFYFGQQSATPISGALEYKARFEWPDNSVTEGVLQWNFEQNNYMLVDPSPAESLLLNEWDFTITVTNEDDF
ncbi:Ig-like domain-containing protein [Vibrio owensii]|uniref:Ig-like domain-containing protein n=1 Tax=Vibrio owensii TaxID=696485 RepID=UPI003AADF09A